MNLPTDHSWEPIIPVECDEPITAKSYQCSVCNLEVDCLTDNVTGKQWIEYYDWDRRADGSYASSVWDDIGPMSCASRVMAQALE